MEVSSAANCNDGDLDLHVTMDEIVRARSSRTRSLPAPASKRLLRQLANQLIDIGYRVLADDPLLVRLRNSATMRTVVRILDRLLPVAEIGKTTESNHPLAMAADRA